MQFEVVLGEPRSPANIRIRSNVGKTLVLLVTQAGLPFDFTSWTGRCSLTDTDGNAYSPPQNPIVTLTNSDINYPGQAVCYVAITRAIANFFKDKNGIRYDVCIDSGASSACLLYGNLTVDVGNSTIP